MTFTLFLSLLYSILSKTAASAIHKGLGRLLYGPPEPGVEEAVKVAIERAQVDFHNRYGHQFGATNNTFIERQQNRTKLLLSTYPRAQRLTATDLNGQGFDGASAASQEALSYFLKAFHRHLEAARSRILNRDLSLQEAHRERAELKEDVQMVGTRVAGVDKNLEVFLQERILPDPIREAIVQPSLDELSELMKAGRAEDALEFATRHTKRIDAALEDVPDPEDRYAEALRSHRQRLLFAAASTSSWLGDMESGHEFWHRARDLGPVDPKWHLQAASALFNVGLADELRRLASQMDPSSEAYSQSTIFLAYLDGDWKTVEHQLLDAQSTDRRLLLIQAKLQLLDPQDVGAVQEIVALLDEIPESLPLATLTISLARGTLVLLEQVVEGYTPLEFDRRPLVDKLTERTNAALEATEPNSLLRVKALEVFAPTATTLRDQKLLQLFEAQLGELDEETLSASSFFRLNPPPTPNEIDLMLSDEQIDSSKAALLRATYYKSTNKPTEAEQVLREAIFSTSDKRQRGQLLRELAGHLRDQNRGEEIEKLLSVVPVRPADHWLIRAENLSADESPADIAAEVEDFPLDVEVLEFLARSSFERLRGEQASPRAEKATTAVEWTRRLTKVLPSRSARQLHAEALLAANQFEELVVVSRDLSPAYGERAVWLEAQALSHLGKGAEAADLLIEACKTHRESEHLAILASELLMADDRPALASELLKPQVDAGTSGPMLLVNYARALLAEAPSSPEAASQAFDLLAEAYDLHPDRGIATEAWTAARGAGRGAEAGRFFEAMMAEAPQIIVKTEEDLQEAMALVGEQKQPFVQIIGGMEFLAEQLRRERERGEELTKILGGHMLPYADLFESQGRAWETWTHLTKSFEEFQTDQRSSWGRYSVLADWPSALFGSVNQGRDRASPLFADITAILTLGVLGPQANQLLDALDSVYVATGTLQELRKEKNRIAHEMQVSAQYPYREAANLLGARRKAIGEYTDETMKVAPDDSNLGVERVDLGVAVQESGLYVSDVDELEPWAEESRRLKISSASLLAALNAAGHVTSDAAERVASRSPKYFKGWDEEKPPPLPSTLVFSEFAFLAWLEADILDALGERVKVGPWAWHQIAEGARRQETLILAHDRLSTAIGVLRRGLSTGTIQEVDPVAHSSSDTETAKIESRLEELWAGALRAIRTAQSHGFQLWADDRFYSFLLWIGGPTATSPEVESLRAPLATWAQETPPISTVSLLNRLAVAERLPLEGAQDAAASLFAKGYRPIHPIMLDYSLRQYVAPTEAPVTPPFRKLVGAIADIPGYLPENIDPRRREGFIRAGVAEISEGFITKAWQAERLNDDQQRLLANAFLNETERIFREASPEAVGPRSDHTSLRFWQGLAVALATKLPVDTGDSDLHPRSMRWLGEAASRRTEQRLDIARLLEDNALGLLQANQDVIASHTEALAVASNIALRTLWPLFESDLATMLDPLLRRTVGTLARLSRRGYSITILHGKIAGQKVTLKIPEEQTEQVAADVLRRAATREPSLQQFIHATDIVFSYRQEVQEGWADVELPPDTPPIPINVRCSLFTLLWADFPDLQELIVHALVFSLANIDPDLASRVLESKADLLSDDAEQARSARDQLALALLQSAYFDLQRDLTHALRRFREYEAEKFERFLGRIGEEPARKLAEAVPDLPISHNGSVVWPISHLLTRGFLTHTSEGAEQFLKVIANLSENESTGKHAEAQVNETEPLTLREWLTDRTSIVETETAFLAAWALNHVLLAMTSVDSEVEVEVLGRSTRLVDWAGNYIETALALNPAEDSKHLTEREQQMVKRRKLASAAFQLAGFACHSDARFAAFQEEEDPLVKWLDQVWLLASKLQITLIGLKGGLDGAVEAAITAVEELGLGDPNARAPDWFDPFLFVHGDDLEVALTLTAIYKCLACLPAADSPPPWWTDKIQSLIEKSAEADYEEEELGNRLGLTVPLRSPVIARRILALPAIASIQETTPPEVNYRDGEPRDEEPKNDPST